MFGALATQLPLRLTSMDPIHGWSAAQHARMCSDIVAGWRSLPLAVVTVRVDASSSTVVSYNGRNGSGSGYAPVATWTSATRPCSMTWNNSYGNNLAQTDAANIYNSTTVLEPWSIRHAIVKAHWSGSQKDTSVRQIPASTNTVDIAIEATPTTPYYITITAYGNWGEERDIGDYGGDLDKTDNVSEAIIPYAAQWYREVHASRGSAYSTKPYSLVDAENIAIARFMSAVFSRTPEKYSANATPARATERLPYWVDVLGVPTNSSEPDYVLRKHCASHYKAALGPSLDVIRTAVSELLGEAFVDIDTYYGSDLENPPFPTFWPGGLSDGGTMSIGGPTWLSRRSHIRISVIEPPGMTRRNFLQLMNVQLYQLLDRILPAWVSWNWSVGTDGFTIGVDKIGIDSI